VSSSKISLDRHGDRQAITISFRMLRKSFNGAGAKKVFSIICASPITKKSAALEQDVLHYLSDVPESADRADRQPLASVLLATGQTTAGLPDADFVLLPRCSSRRKHPSRIHNKGEVNQHKLSIKLVSGSEIAQWDP